MFEFLNKKNIFSTQKKEHVNAHVISFLVIEFVE